MAEIAHTGDALDRGEIAKWRTRTLCVLFFFSGFPALIYQLSWQRTLFRIFGVNVEAVTIIVTAFMIGLGVGSLVGGWLTQNRRLAALPIFAAIEILTGAFGVMSLAVFEAVGDLTTDLSLPLTAAITLALVCIPTLLMGATLPILVGYFGRRVASVGSAVGLLYYFNTLGAGAACIITALMVFPLISLSTAINLAAVMNFAVGGAALFVYWREKRSLTSWSPVKDNRHAPKPSTLRFTTATALAFAGGFVSLSYEIFYFRIISFATGSSATAFATTLGAFLVGLAAGARQAGADCESLPNEQVAWRSVSALIKANLVGLALVPILAHSAWLGSGIMILIILSVYFAGRFWGSLFPYLAGLSIANDGQTGIRVALLYLANILGSAAGSIITGFFLMEYAGLVSTGAILAVAGLLCMLFLNYSVSFQETRYRKIASGVAMVGLATAPLMPIASTQLLETLQWKAVPAANLRFSETVETRSGIIAVTKDRTVYGNGMYDGRFNVELKNDTNGIVRPYALSLFHPSPRDVLLIGLSSGSWAQVIANNPNVKSLTVIEINPGYLKLIAAAPEVASLLQDPKVSIIIGDGRRWLRANPSRRFDAIVSNTTYHYRSNVTNLLSVEFLDLVRRHLNKGGVVFYNTTDSDRVQRTGCLAYRYGARFLNHMILSDDPIRWDFGRWRRTIESYRIDGRTEFNAADKLDREKLDTLSSWEGSLRTEAGGAVRPIEPCEDTLKRTQGIATVTDDNMGSEWRHALRLD